MADFNELDARFSGWQWNPVRYLCEINSRPKQWEGQQDRRPA
ncbi:MAG TPA: hypothetical protein VF360_07105 [Candidatus Methanoperedens sp.]